MAKAWPVDGIDPDASLEENARRILAVRIAELYSYEAVLDDPREMKAHHDQRIAAKRLRYTLELFRAVFGELGELQIERIKQIQELLGQLHDTDVRIALIEDELAKLAIEQTVQLGRSLASAPSTSHQAIATAALRPPPDDPRRGLYALLGRQYALRQETFIAFQTRWTELKAEGMRADLVKLSSTPIPVSIERR